MKSILKNTRFFALFLFLVLAITGCEDELDSKVFSDLTPENFFQTDKDFNAALVALYSSFSIDWGGEDPGIGIWYTYLFNANNRTYLLRSELTTDELWNDWDANILNFTWGPATYSGTGASTYSRIRYVARATDVIDKIENSSVDDVVKNRYLGEAKTLRAWLMYIMYDFFGPVNVKVDPSTLSDTSITPRLSVEEYTRIIEQDLLDAIATDELPEKYNGTADWGRVSKGVARMLLLKLYMHQKEWAKAEDIGKAIISSGSYGLLANYDDVFIQTGNDELIYAIASNEAVPNWYMQHLFPGNYAKGFAGTKLIERGGGWYGYSMPWEFYDKFEIGDLRTNTIITEFESGGGALVDRDNGLRGAIPLKYTSIEGQGSGPSYSIDWVIFRYAEVLLSVAEAINEQRGPADAYQYVNQVRERAGVTPWSGLTQEEFRDAILDERGRELFCEGHRRQDLVRHGKFIEKAIERGATSASSKHLLFPIPADVILEGGGTIEQNPGY
ncbi:RagB/SusD family nutrient uptake outer membrane protein [Flagellimonas myxillae]|uniref:RagB/SusD family nutrient uptake outer membrane protein n=1 Tax=Flagellimonas myxillae TaxID=2942214 RepID=UPI00201E8FDE|nr:RagB/SusD family nutrient uptake outer membrane protein [Muricauda myxillae]MCL6266329.1 RagB/SusD family nutrient uptake outer membrane protein [Muricauda myxillae]